MSHIAVFGAGSWGTAFSTILAGGGCRVNIAQRIREDIACTIDTYLARGSTSRQQRGSDQHCPACRESC